MSPRNQTTVKCVGSSIAGESTGVGIIFPDGTTCVFDLGGNIDKATFKILRNTKNLVGVCISHGHLDHTGGFLKLVQELSHSDGEITIFAPDACTNGIRLLIDAAAALQGPERSVFKHKIISNGDDDRHKHNIGSHTVIETFKTMHTVPSQGYIVYKPAKTLKEKFQGGQQEAAIRAARQRGEEIYDHVLKPEVAFTGDTNSLFIVQNDERTLSDIFNAPLLILEMTYVDDQFSRERARERGHMHIDDLVEHADKFKNSKILLIHFSPRYTQEDILEALDRKLPPGLRERCVPLLDGFEHRLNA